MFVTPIEKPGGGGMLGWGSGGGEPTRSAVLFQVSIIIFLSKRTSY